MTTTKLANLIDQRSSEKNIASVVASYLIDTKKTQQLDSLMRDVMNAREMHGTYEINVISAHKLSSSQVDKVKAYVLEHFDGCKEIIVHQTVDPALLGGIRIESVNSLVNRSLRGELNYIKASIDKQGRMS